MPVSPETEPYMEKEWVAAVADSGIAPDRVHLLPVKGAPVPNGVKAVCYRPDDLLEPDDFLWGEMRKEANSPAVRMRHRVAIFEDLDETDPVEVAVMAGKLRHELRHAEQRIACGDSPFQLFDVLDETLRLKVGGLPRGAVFYQFVPIEMDCNAAAARFLRSRHGNVINDVLVGDDGALARSNTSPGELPDLETKMVACLFCFREIAEQLPTQAGSIEAELGRISAGAAETWRGLLAAG